MKRLKGGEFLIDLTPIAFEESVDAETYTNITNESVLKQLTLLKNFINSNGLKPAWIKLKNDETDDIVVVNGEISKVDGSPEFDIHVKIRGYNLTIHVEFTQMVNEDSELIDDWYIDTNDAKYLFTSDAQFVGNAISGGNVDNAKPIYCHPIQLQYNVTEQNGYITCLIFNNDSTPFTFTSWYDYVNNLITNYGAVIMCSGALGFLIEGFDVIATCIKLSVTNTLAIHGIRTDNHNFSYYTIYRETVPLLFTDGVNKIN